MDRAPRRLLVSFLLLVLLLPAAPVAAQAPGDPFTGCDSGLIPNTGASWAICMPARLGVPWNGDLIIFAHGYVSPYPERPPEIPLEQYTLADGTTIPNIANFTGYAFATTSFRTNGLAVKDGVADLMDLLGEFKLQHPLKRPARVYLIGASEGGLITALAIEKHQAQFDGGVAACGPIGDFRKQIDYLADTRVVFDALFPGALPPTAIDIPPALIADWPTLAPSIGFALATNPGLTSQLIAVTGAAVDPANPATALDTALGVLWYNIFATNDARLKLGGNPFDNSTRTYSGSLNDPLLNALVVRYQADTNALASIKAQYQTSGRLRTPLITLHNTLDPIVPYAHVVLYGQKVAASGSSALYAHISAPRYGHCNFTSPEIMASLGWIVTMSGAAPISNARAALPGNAAYARYLRLTMRLQSRR